MTQDYLNALKGVPYRGNVRLHPSERAVFVAPLEMVGTETDRLIGSRGSEVVLTTRRLVVSNGTGVFSSDVSDIAACRLVQERWLLQKVSYVAISLRNAVAFDNHGVLTGYRLYFKKRSAERDELDRIVRGLLG